METQILNIFNLFKEYHNENMKSFKMELINEILSIFKDIKIRSLPSKPDKNKSHICGYNRSRNRGTCKRLCYDIFCNYHIKYVNVKNNNKKGKKVVEIIDNNNLYSHNLNIYNYFDKEKINNDNYISEKKINKIKIKDYSSCNLPILFSDKNKSDTFITNILTSEINKARYNCLLEINEIVRLRIKKCNINETYKVLLPKFIDKITNNLKFNEKTDSKEIDELVKNIYIKLNKYLDFQIKNNKKVELICVKSIFDIYKEIF